MRLLGAFLIVLASGCSGIYLARGFVQRPKHLKQFLVALKMLGTEIHYAHTSLPEACERIAQQSKPPISVFFQTVWSALESGDGQSAREAWQESMAVLRTHGFSHEELTVIEALGHVLGRSDASDQMKHLTLLERQLQGAIERAEEDRDRNVRLFNYLGFCVGMLLVILLY